MSRILVGGAALLAVLFEGAVYGVKPGLGYLVLWAAALVVTTGLLKAAERVRYDRLWMFLPSLLLAFSVFRYDATVIQVWGSGLCLLTLTWAIAWNLPAEGKVDALSRFLPSGSYHLPNLVSGARASLKVQARFERETTVQVTRGIFLALGLLILFGGLLVNADAVFLSKVKTLLEALDIVTPAPVVRTGLWLFLAVGVLRLWLLAPLSQPKQAYSFFSSTELYIALGSVNLLFLSFLGIQVRYLFGDARLVETLGIGHATYARRGFFELSLCIALLLPLVLVAYRAAEVHRDSRLRYLGGALILAAGGLSVSALKRMVLYIQAYGLSVERFYAAAGIVVAMILLGWTAYACLNPKPVGWLVARQNITLVFLLALLAQVNVDEIVARSHLNLVQEGKQVADGYYLANQLSTDALEVFGEFAPRLKPQDQAVLAEAEKKIRATHTHQSGASFNISRWKVSR